MAEITAKQRNNTVDVIRGIAMLLVVLGHTITGCTENYEDTFLYNIIWTLQMPLFMLISGYVNKYSKPILSFKALVLFLLKKTKSYLLPFAVWTFVIRGIVFGQTSYLNIKSLIYHMDRGYWFLFSVWSIVIILGIANFLSEVILKKCGEYVRLIGTTVFYLCGMFALACIGYAMGLSFLCIKLTLYYMPFYYAGYLYGKLDIKLTDIKYFAGFKDAVIAVSFIIWIFLINRYNFYEIGDGGMGIILRAIASLLGCIAVCGLVASIISNSRSTVNPLSWGTTLLALAGKYSLEIYLSHYLLICMVKMVTVPKFTSAIGLSLVFCNYFVTLIIVFVFLKLISKNKMLNLILFGKSK